MQIKVKFYYLKLKMVEIIFCYKGIINNDRLVCKDDNKVYPVFIIKLINSDKLEHTIEKMEIN